jgi:hypothetical protein
MADGSLRSSKRNVSYDTSTSWEAEIMNAAVKLVSIIVPSIHKEKLSGFFDNLQQMALEQSSFEVVVKIDEGDSEMLDHMVSEASHRPFVVKYLVTPRLDGYWTLYIGVNECLKIISEDTYFVWITNDEVRIATKHWDSLLRKYKGLFDDDIFCLRTSTNRHRSCSLVDCLPRGEHFGFFTRKWYHISEGLGIGAQCTGGELVNWYLRRKCGLYRSVPIDDIVMKNADTAACGFHGLSTEEIEAKDRRLTLLYTEILSWEIQEGYYRRARLLHAHVWANESGLSDYKLVDDATSKVIEVWECGKSIPLNRFSYKLPLLEWLQTLLQSAAENEQYFQFCYVWANLLRAKRSMAVAWLNMPDAAVEREFLGDLGNCHKTLYFMLKHGCGFQESVRAMVRDGKNILDGLRQHVSGITNHEADESFYQSLVRRCLDRGRKQVTVQDLLAISLYAEDAELPFALTSSQLPEWILNEPFHQEILKKFRRPASDSLAKLSELPLATSLTRKLRKPAGFMLRAQRSLLERLLRLTRALCRRFEP